MNSYTYEYIETHPKETKRLLGLDYDQLQNLIDYLLFLDEKNREAGAKSPDNLIKAGGGRKAKITKESQIILTLVYLRHHLSFQLLGILFQVSESTAHEYFYYWKNIIRTVLPSSLIEQGEQSGNLEDIMNKLEEYILLIDSEEQAIERPSSYQEQKDCYSGKKKQHTFKNQIISIKNLNNLQNIVDIIDVVAGEYGPKSDITICRETLGKFTEAQKFLGDKAYVGEKNIITPKKKPKNGELSEIEKDQNRQLSKTRIFIEHLIRIIKIFKVTQERFRLKKSRYKDVFLTVCGLVRLRIGSVILKIIKSQDLLKTIDVFISNIWETNLNFSVDLT